MKLKSKAIQNSRSNNRPYLNRVISNINKSIFNTYQDKSLSIKRPSQEQKFKKLSSEEILTSRSLGTEHGISTQGYQILDLNKQPFGIHSNYNDFSKFLSHFMPIDDSSHTMREDFRHLNKKIKLANKHRSKITKKLSLKSCIYSSLHDKYVYPTKAGSLVCERELGKFDPHRNSSTNKNPRNQKLKSIAKKANSIKAAINKMNPVKLGKNL